MYTTKLNPIARHILMRSIVKQSGDDLKLTAREKTMVKWFIKFSFSLVFVAVSWIIPILALESHLERVKSLEESIIVDVPKIITLPSVATKTIVPAVVADEYKSISKTFRTVTAYNAGDPSQTDSSPCIGASGKDICKMLENGQKIAAANFVPLGSKLKINGEIYTVEDRMAKKHGQRVDIAMRLDEKARAIKFGAQTLEVEILK